MGAESTVDVLRRETGVRGLTDREFRQLRELIFREAGIYLSDAKKALLLGRLSRRLSMLGLTSYGEYYERVAGGDAQERIHMLDAISTNETHFFREPGQFEFLEKRVLPAWIAAANKGERPRRLRAWSAACSTGEEPYSLAMLLLSMLPPELGFSIEVLGSDISTRVLAAATAGVWPLARAREIPEPHLKRFMLRGVRAQEGRMKAGPELRASVRFERINLRNPVHPAGGPFDLVFCRNVLIYFRQEDKADVVDRLLAHLAPGGLLLLGHAESLLGHPSLRPVGPMVYARTR